VLRRRVGHLIPSGRFWQRPDGLRCKPGRAGQGRGLGGGRRPCRGGLRNPLGEGQGDRLANRDVARLKISSVVGHRLFRSSRGAAVGRHRHQHGNRHDQEPIPGRADRSAEPDSMTSRQLHSSRSESDFLSWKTEGGSIPRFDVASIGGLADAEFLPLPATTHRLCTMPTRQRWLVLRPGKQRDHDAIRCCHESCARRRCVSFDSTASTPILAPALPRGSDPLARTGRA